MKEYKMYLIALFLIIFSLFQIQKYLLHYKITCNTQNRLDNIKFYLINLQRDKHRLSNFVKHFPTNFTIIPAVDKRKSENFPLWRCNIDPSRGTKALQLSIINVLKQAKQDKCEWAVIFEDDAEPPKDFLCHLQNALNKHRDSKVIYMDIRNSVESRKSILSKIRQVIYRGDGIIPVSCTNCVVYHKSIFDIMIRELNPNTSLYMQKYYHKGKACNSDFYAHWLLTYLNIKGSNYPIVENAKVESTLNGQF